MRTASASPRSKDGDQLIATTVNAPLLADDGNTVRAFWGSKYGDHVGWDGHTKAYRYGAITAYKSGQVTSARTI